MFFYDFISLSNRLGIPLFNLTNNINHTARWKNLLAFFKYSMHANVDK